MTSAVNRRIRREVARQNLPRVEALAVEVRVNRPDYSHITVWVSDGSRLEWWPGNHKWQDGAEYHRGTITDFIEYLRRIR